MKAENVKKDGVFADNKKQKYAPSDERKKDQGEVDKQVGDISFPDFLT